MKKFLTVVVAVLMTATSANAQYYNTKHELQVSVGVNSNSEILSALSDAFSNLGSLLITSTLSLGSSYAFDSYENEKYMPSIAVGYYYNVTPMVAVGGYLAYNGMSRDIIANTKTGSSSSKEKVGESTRNNFSIIPSAKFHWVRTKHFGFYSKIGVGAMLLTEKAESDKGSGDKSDSTVFFDFDVTPIGLDAGSEQMRGFVELGLNEQGLVCGGVRYKF